MSSSDPGNPFGLGAAAFFGGVGPSPTGFDVAFLIARAVGGL
jgi:hypothetical protein